MLKLKFESGLRFGEEMAVCKPGGLVGRDPGECRVLLKDPGVSSRHAFLASSDEMNWSVRDLDSRNGTFLNDTPIGTRETKLPKQGSLRFGNVDVSFWIGSSLELKTNPSHSDTAGSYPAPETVVQVLSPNAPTASSVVGPRSAVQLGPEQEAGIPPRAAEQPDGHRAIPAGMQESTASRDMLSQYEEQDTGTEAANLLALFTTSGTLEEIVSAASRGSYPLGMGPAAPVPVVSLLRNEMPTAEPNQAGPQPLRGPQVPAVQELQELLRQASNERDRACEQAKELQNRLNHKQEQNQALRGRFAKADKDFQQTKDQLEALQDANKRLKEKIINEAEHPATPTPPTATAANPAMKGVLEQGILMAQRFGQGLDELSSLLERQLYEDASAELLKASLSIADLRMMLEDAKRFL